jgi:hypothetical protein
MDPDFPGNYFVARSESGSALGQKIVGKKVDII